MSIKNVFTDWFTILIGASLMVFGIGSWFFHWPHEPKALDDAIAAALGFMIMFIDKELLAQTIFAYFKKKSDK